VCDGVEQPADGAAHDRHTARHRLDGHDAERLVPRRAHCDVGRAQERGDRVARERTGEPHAVGHAVLLRDGPQADDFAVAVEGLQPGSPDDDELGGWDPGQRTDPVVDAFARYEPADGDEAGHVVAPQRGGAAWREDRRVHSTRDDRDRCRLIGECGEFVEFVAAGRHDQVDAACQ
jgi:hypothetical protein